MAGALCCAAGPVAATPPARSTGPASRLTSGSIVLYRPRMDAYQRIRPHEGSRYPMRILTPDPSVDYAIIRVTPDPSVAYPITIVRP
jgi:hypothetical protein